MIENAVEISASANVMAPAIEGEANVVRIADKVRAPSFRLEIVGDCNTVEIGEGCTFLNGGLRIHASDARFVVGRFTSIGQARIFLHEPAAIEIGRGCMFSTGIFISASDMHSVFDADGERINPAASVSIGNRVWLGLDCAVLKGSTIGDGSVLGARSLVNGNIPPACLAAGNPAKVIRENISWTRKLQPKLPSPSLEPSPT